MAKILLRSFLCATFLLGAAQAITLNWDTDFDWPAGSLIQTIPNVDGSGIDMTFTWDGANPGSLLNNYQVPGYPGYYATLPDDNPVEDIMPGVDSGIWYATTGPSSINLVIEFSESVTNVSFDLFDIDGVGGGGTSTNFKEYLRVIGFLANGTAVLPTNAGGGSDVGLEWWPAATGIIFVNGGLQDQWPPYAANEAWVNFAGPIKKIGFEFKNNDGVRGQILGDITFLPEPATLVLLSIGGLAAIRRKR
jgi:hypothetical protein